ncbi:Methyltransferase domain-containing protein [Rhodovulum sp. ES.010]|uniref:class I SAM-dependent methyltransferase n=1 Tax=Rhodovulum sp. ES.010 TaxID=1882821 RepID=UPI00092B8A36|nr:class I SAM-dependent methyltransferase [Rhodovulum sp. ES.010]SIO03249.1 Methyltransferase domain-containing protein [Rhodovulum sp. ES.010]
MKEEDIRPQAMFDEYLKLAAEDAETYFGTAPREPIDCPACGAEGAPEFTKSGFTYDLCPDCQTLYVSPRPPASAFSAYYREAPSTRFWATRFYRETAEARREKLWKPKARRVVEIMETHLDDAGAATVVDIGGGYGIFAEEIGKLTERPAVVIEPGPGLADACREKGLAVIEAFLEDVAPGDLPPAPRVFVSFELFEHLHSPRDFIGALGRLMSPGDLFVFTTLSGVGADIQALWEDSKSVSPPHHLNFFNPKSAAQLLERMGFEVLDATTPGRLDMDIMANNADRLKDRFWRTMAAYLSEAEKARMQDALAAAGLSSHMMIVARFRT